MPSFLLGDESDAGGSQLPAVELLFAGIAPDADHSDDAHRSAPPISLLGRLTAYTKGFADLRPRSAPLAENGGEDPDMLLGVVTKASAEGQSEVGIVAFKIGDLDGYLVDEVLGHASMILDVSRGLDALTDGQADG
jgi:hypothetical protein